MTWKEKILQTLKKATDKIVEIDLDKKTITYNKVNNKRGIVSSFLKVS